MRLAARQAISWISAAAPARDWEDARQSFDLAGGPGRTRTCNQTVMSGEGDPEDAENIDE
jgi:hypothetical protein